MPMATTMEYSITGLSSCLTASSDIYFDMETTTDIKYRQDLTIREELQEEVDNWLEGVV